MEFSMIEDNESKGKELKNEDMEGKYEEALFGFTVHIAGTEVWTAGLPWSGKAST
ncbi:hypothetical protein CDL12_00413 [Handroanthus impetiginosus]|uniref:Uncharacterized protein n=1 Tax=Handroanthus impetiginosus TaxID=429701 RepID=A0A2G9IAP0_9LAMI|nr:hypothetical protein CDL12_00413 [Handroanthus impetiginosus]